MSGGLSNISRRFFSLDPTNLSSTSGPLTTVIGRSGDSNDPICLANNVLPHPGLPYNKRPRTGWIPNSLNNDGGAARGVHILRLISTRTSSNPPIPNSPPSKEWPDPARAIICETRPAAISAAATCSGLGAAPLFSSPFTLVPPPPPPPSTVWEQAQSVPNMITLSRLASTPLLCYWIVNGHYNLALYGLVAAAFSDGLDGYIAKNHCGGTVLGTYLDPLADKFLVNGLGCALWYAGILPTPLVCVWALKDILLLGGTGWYLYKEQHTVNFLSNSVATKPLTVTPTFLGKANTGLQFATLSIGVVSPVFGPDIIPPEMFSKLCWVTGIITVASLFSYTGKSGIKTAQNNNKH
mmetsp:Transcript_52057/g.125656  ORF Transcript_52057/g.125656 Transcript_52057/m.125656 type:complete len:352 (-) Transcript_52057:33-1088(-)